MLQPEDYAVGRTIKNQDNEVTVRDTFSAGSGNGFLIVGNDDSPIAALLPIAALRDEDSDWEAVSPEDVDAARTDRDAVSDETEATDIDGEYPDRDPNQPNPDVPFNPENRH